MEFKLAPAAKGDVLEIADYYTETSADLAERFVAELGDALERLCFKPGLGSRRYAHLLPDTSLRVWQLDHFPYMLFYIFDDTGLNVLRVLHERRDLSNNLIAR